MLWNNIKIALRNLRKYKGFAAINILGLALGLSIYVLGGLIYDYEKSHDMFYENSERIYTIGSTASPEAKLPFVEFDAVWSTVGPMIETEVADVESVARTITSEFLLTMGSESFYEGLYFADPSFTRIFNFSYIHGDESALEDPSGILITEEIAIKYFGHTDVRGEVVTFDNEFDFHVAAVIKNLPRNTHFNSSFVLDQQMGIVAPLLALNRMRDWDMAGNWNNLSLGNMTYVLVPQGFDGAWAQGPGRWYLRTTRSGRPERAAR